MALRHGIKRNIVRSFRNPQNHTRVLHREESLGHNHVENEGEDQGSEGDQQGCGLVLQHPFHGAAVRRDDPVVKVFCNLVETAFLAFLAMLEQLGAHHRSQAQRNPCRDQDGNRQRDRELAEEPAHNVSHKQQRNQHGNQRNRKGDDGEPNLSRPVEGRIERRISGFQVAVDVFDHHDGVIHHEAGGDG